MTHRKLIEQMLEALRGSAGPDEINNVREAAREYLAQPEQSEQTPTAETNDATFGAILFSFIRLSLVYPNEAQLHQLDRLIAFYGDQKFASQLRLLAHQARTPNVNRGVGRTTHLKFSGSAGIGTAPPLRELSPEEIDAVLRKVGILANLKTLREIAYAILAEARGKTP